MFASIRSVFDENLDSDPVLHLVSQGSDVDSFREVLNPSTADGTRWIESLTALQEEGWLLP